MIQKIIAVMLSLFLINVPNIFAQGTIQLELFNIQQGKVIQTAPSSTAIQQAAKGYLKNIDNIYVKLNPIPEKGVMIKIPLEQSVQIQNKWMNSLVDEIIIISSKEENPYLLTFDDENHAHVFTFKGGNTDILLETFNLDLKDF
jgi:hypothetical protein